MSNRLPKEKSGDVLSLELGGDNLTADKFARAVNSFISVLDGVSRQFSSDTRNIDWIVQVKGGSNIVNMTPCVDAVAMRALPGLISAIQSGVDIIEDREVWPEHFPEKSLRALRHLGDLHDPESSPNYVRISINNNQRDVTHRSVGNVDQLLAGVMSAHGSVDGRLQMVTERGGLRFMLYDYLTDQGVRCTFNEEKLSEVTHLFGKRVEVFGEIRYRKDGVPISIKVDHFDPFPEPADLPSANSVRGILGRAEHSGH